MMTPTPRKKFFWFKIIGSLAFLLGLVLLLAFLSPQTIGNDWYIPVYGKTSPYGDNEWRSEIAPEKPTANWKSPEIKPDNFSYALKDGTLSWKATAEIDSDFSNIQRGSVIHADSNGTATLSDGTVVSLKQVSLLKGINRKIESQSFSIKEGHLVPLESAKIPPSRWGVLHVTCESSTPARIFNKGGLFDAQNFSAATNTSHILGYNNLERGWMLKVFHDTPLAFCLSLQHGKPHHKTVDAKHGSLSTDSFGNICYLGETHGLAESIDFETATSLKIKTPSSSSAQSSRFALFAYSTPPRRFTDAYDPSSVTIRLENGQEYPAPDFFCRNNWIVLQLPAEIGDTPIASYTFAQPGEFSRIAFTIPSLIDLFPENKGVTNRFDLKVPSGILENPEVDSSDIRWLLTYTLGINMAIDGYFPIGGGTFKETYFPKDKEWKTNAEGKTLRQLLLECADSIGVKPEGIVIDTNKGYIYLRRPLMERLDYWLKNPTLKRWPWDEP